MKIFKAGIYPQGIFTKKDLESMISGVQIIPGILGHTSGWRELKVPSQAIPRAAEFSNLRIVGDYIEADVNLTEFGKKFISGGAIKDVSVEIDIENKKLRKVGMLGAVPPQIKDLDALQSLEFSDKEEKSLIIEFNEEGGGKQVDLEQIVAGLNLEQKLEVLKLIGGSITKDQKAAFRAIAYEFAEITKTDEVKEFAKKLGLEVTEIISETKEQMEARLRTEIKKEGLLKEFSEKSKTKIIPAMQPKVEALAKELIKTTGTEVEFSEGVKGDLWTVFQDIILGKDNVLPEEKKLEFGETDIKNGSATEAAKAMWGQK